MKREAMLKALGARREPWDIVVIGGGATGVGIALDAATRGYSVALFEAYDFGKGTSSRSTKLVHGGVRYLRNGQIGMVMEALEERGLLRRNAPDLVSDLSFIVPIYHAWEWAMYGAGLKAYDWLAGKYGFGKTEILSRAATIGRMPSVRTEGLRGGILYHDGQCDDAGLLIQIARTAADHGAVLVNYAPVLRIDGKTVTARDAESSIDIRVEARIVINAAGPFSDRVRQLADPGSARTVATSQGAHIVVDGSFLPGETALMVPRTSDGRVLFAIPWLGHTLIGTTDTPVDQVVAEPRALESEIEFILSTSRCCLSRPPGHGDVLSSFAGIRPLVLKGRGGNTAALSRDHILRFERSGMLTIIGGKWTTYRHMAEDCVNHAARAAGLPERACVTRHLPIRAPEKINPEPRLHPALPYGEMHIAHAVREQMARTLEDVLGRRTRALFLNARAAVSMAPAAGTIMARELGWPDQQRDTEIAAFTRLAAQYQAHH
jgi:glycerol-3-phosphate dehydrogenase